MLPSSLFLSDLAAVFVSDGFVGAALLFWQAGSEIENLYWWIAVLSTGFIVLRLLLSLVGVELDHEFDLDFGDSDFGDISLSAFATLFAIAGWAGVLGYHFTDFGDMAIVGIAISAGLVGFVVAILTHQKLKKLEQSGNLDLRNAIGKVGEVYLTIPQEGEGQVQIVVQGKLQTLDAKSEGLLIPTGEKVMVYEVENGKLLVGRFELHD
ncbi:NfeD family protein [Hugenholtzia roseola]|uniref:NfeD family protein n=1 Tax=Hugenholtzia roseola TaxID=1002 RepID=UPI00040393C7|nr:NfeD family protein [Hugenholtzia roseola]